MKEIDKLKETLEEIHKLAEESVLYLPKLKSLDHKKEPLIKDEEVRMAVYLWASSLGIGNCKCNKKINNGVEVIGFEFLKLASSPRIEFPIWCIHADVTDGRIYTITELCGEEEE